MPKRCRNDAKTMPKRCQNATKTMPKRRQNATKTPPKRHQTPPNPHIFAVFCGENTQSARGGNRTAYRPVPTRPQAAGPTTMLIPPRSPRLLSGFLCTGNTGPGRAVRVNCRPSRKTRLLKILDAQYPKTSLFRSFSRKNTLRRGFLERTK